jgi:hypothetical protein
VAFLKHIHEVVGILTFANIKAENKHLLPLLGQFDFRLFDSALVNASRQRLEATIISLNVLPVRV